MIEFKSGEATSFTFEMLITGDLAGAPTAWFEIQAEGFCLSFKALERGTGVWNVDVPPLDRFIGPGSYPCKINVVLGDRIFTPMQDACTIKVTPKPVISAVKMSTTSVTPEIKITMAPTAPAPMPAPVPAVESKIVVAVKPGPKAEDLDVFGALLKK